VSSFWTQDTRSMTIAKHGRAFAENTWQERDFVRPLVSILGALLAVLALEIGGALAMTHGQFMYASDAAYTHMTLAQQITHGTYGLYPGEASAPSSTILYPVLLAFLQPLGLGTTLPLFINIVSTLATGFFAFLLARETSLPIHRIAAGRLFLLTAVIAVALDLPGLAILGLEHSLHIAMTVAYLLGLVRFVRRGRCDWWWFVCILVQPIIRFEAAGMLVADALIFVAFRRYGYALATFIIGLVLVGAYSLFLHSLGLPILPSSVLSRSDWSNAALVSHSGPFSVIASIVENLYSNLRSFGAAQMLGGVALATPWLGWIWADLWKRPPAKADQIKLVTLGFMAFVTLAQLTGGRLDWVPPRYEAYVLVLNLCGLAIIFRERVSAWCEFATWPRSVAFCLALMMVFAGYAAQFLFIPARAEKEFEGSYQLHRFALEFYRRPVAANFLGYINFENPNYVLDLSGLSSESARQSRAREQKPDWMDELMEKRGVDLAIIDSTNVTSVPKSWIKLADLRPAGLLADEAYLHYIFYVRHGSDVPAAAEALDRFARTLPTGSHLQRLFPGGEEGPSG